MKRLLPLITAALMLPLGLQAQTPPAKPAPKPAAKAQKPAAPEAAAPAKAPLMTRDELRACMKQVEVNDVEAKAINAAQAARNQERDELLKSEEALKQVIKDRAAALATLNQERADMLKAGEELKVKLPTVKKEEAEVMIAAYNAQAAAFDAKADAYNKSGGPIKEQTAAREARVDKYNQGKDALVARAEAHNRNIEAWKASCADRRYDEADEIAIKAGK